MSSLPSSSPNGQRGNSNDSSSSNDAPTVMHRSYSNSGETPPMIRISNSLCSPPYASSLQGISYSGSADHKHVNSGETSATNLLRKPNALGSHFPITLSKFGASPSGTSDSKLSEMSHIFFQTSDSSPRPPRNRKPNYSENEKQIFFVLISPHIDLLDAKSQERQIMNLKTETWKEVTRKYNDIIQTLPGNYVLRDYEELRTFWKNIRRTNRRKSQPPEVPDFEDRLSSCEGSKGDGASGSYLSCASSIPSIVEDSGEPGLLKNAMGCGDDRSYYSEDDIIGVKSELSFPPDIVPISLMKPTNQDSLHNGCGSGSGSSLRYGAIRPRSPSHAAKNKTPEDRVCEFGWMLTERSGKLICRACNMNLDHTRRSTIVEHLRSRKHQRFLEESGFDIPGTQAASITPIVLMEIDEENVVENTRSSSPVSRTASPTSSGMTGPYLLKKETHCSSILDELLKDDTFTDVTLSAEGQHIRAHRIILCLSSKYFKEVLSKESSAKNVIFFRDIKYDELKNLITFIYTGEVTVDAADLESFMKTAELLEVTSLCEGHKNFPKGFPLSKNSTGVSKPTTSSSKRTNSSLATHSPPSKTRKITSTTETPAQCKPRRKRSNAFSTPSTPVTVKSEPVTADSEDEDDLKEETVETSSTFIDVGHLSSEDEIGLASAARLAQGLTPEKLESTADATQVTNVTVTPGRCPFCSPTRQLYIGPIMLTHLQISHPDETAYPCDNCYSVFINKISFLAHHKECKR